MTDRPTSEVLNLAADLIEERGWAKGNCGMAATGPTCLEGALGAALGLPTEINAGETNWTDEVPFGAKYYCYSAVQRTVVYAALAAYLADRHNGHLWGFNDGANDAAEIIEVLRSAAVVEAAREDEQVDAHHAADGQVA